jgi:dynein heavy chain 2
LENTTLIESLTRTKEKSAEIESALIQSAEASVKLDRQREVYRSFASAGSKLYFIVKSLKTINNMYQFSLASFLGLFKKTMNTDMNVKDMVEKLNILRSTLEVAVLDFVGRALFKSDRLMFALNLIKRMHQDHFQPKEWEIFTGVLVSSVSEGDYDY